MEQFGGALLDREGVGANYQVAELQPFVVGYHAVDKQVLGTVGQRLAVFFGMRHQITPAVELGVPLREFGMHGGSAGDCMDIQLA